MNANAVEVFKQRARGYETSRYGARKYPILSYDSPRLHQFGRQASGEIVNIVKIINLKLLIRQTSFHLTHRLKQPVPEGGQRLCGRGNRDQQPGGSSLESCF